MKHFYALILSFFIVPFSFSQTQNIAFTAVGKGVATTFLTDYHCLGINSSMLGLGTGFQGKRFTMGSSEFGFGIYSDSLSVDKLRNLSKAVRSSITNKSLDSLDYQRQIEATAQYAQAGVAMFAEFNWMGFSFQNEKFGGIAFNIRENYQWYSKFNDKTTDLIFRGKLASLFDSVTVDFGGVQTTVAYDENMSQDSLDAVVSGKIAVPINLSAITKGSELRMVWNRSYNLGYGRKLFGKDSVFTVYGGIGGRIISSMAMFNMVSDDDGLVMYTSLTPSLNVNFDPTIPGTNPLTSSSGLLPPSVGQGYGVDLSATVEIGKFLRMSAAVNNIGSVTYKRNVYRVADTLFGDFSLSGLSSEDITKTVNQMLQEGGLLKLEGQEKYVLANAADFRLGASLKFKEFAHFGIDFVAPFNKDNPGSIQNAVIAVGGEIRPAKWLALNVGYFGGGIYKSNIPCGITFILKNGGYEFGIASRDALTFFTKNSNCISGALGFARFRF
jgi:hypothetical protein